MGTVLCVFGWNFENFFEFFWKVSKTRHSMENWAKKISKNSPQNTFKTRLDTFGNDFGYFWNFEFFLIFLKIFEDSTLHGLLGIKFFKKFAPKHVQNTFGYFWVRFWANSENWEFFGFFQDLEVSSLHGTLGKKYFGKNLPQNKFKTRLDTFGNDFRLFWNFENFWYFFENFRRLDPPWKTGQKFFEKIAPKHVQNSFEYFWERFWAFLEFWNFFDFFENFWKLDHPWNTGQKIFEKIAPKHVQNTFGFFCERFWAFLEFWNFFDFFENFRRLDPPWKTGQKNYRKIRPKTRSKHVWMLLGTIWGIFGILTFFWFFWKFSKTRHSMENWAKIFRKICPKTCSKHFWILFGTILGFFGILKFFWFFWKFLKTRPSMEHWAKNFRKKFAPKHVQNTFGYFWERFWVFLEFWNFFDIFENFRRLDPPWITGHKIFQKIRPKTRSKHVWILLGTILGKFGKLRIFRFFSRFRSL